MDEQTTNISNSGSAATEGDQAELAVTSPRHNPTEAGQTTHRETLSK